MPRYLVAIHRHDDYDPARAEDDAMRRDIAALNAEMVASGVRVFVAGLHPAADAKSLRRGRAGEVAFTDGPHLETAEHMSGFWVLEVADLDSVLDWARKAAIACRAPVEVRGLH